MWKCGASMKEFNFERLMKNLFPPELWGPERLLRGSMVVFAPCRLLFPVGAPLLLGLGLDKVFRPRESLSTAGVALTARSSGNLCERFLLGNLVLVPTLLRRPAAELPVSQFDLSVVGGLLGLVGTLPPAFVLERVCFPSLGLRVVRLRRNTHLVCLQIVSFFPYHPTVCVSVVKVGG